MEYKQVITELIHRISETIIDLKVALKRSRPPTQAFSEFLTNREQGDWAEDLVRTAVNKYIDGFVAVQYGKSDDIVAGEEGFKKFYEAYQDELNNIGKRPDILLFRQADYDPNWHYDISRFSQEELTDIIPNAIAGIEVRSSSFLLDKYEAAMKCRNDQLIHEILAYKENLLSEYSDVLDSKGKWKELVSSINKDCIDFISFKVPGWRASQRLTETSELLKELKRGLSEYQKRDFLSFTPKVEDIKVVYKWVQTYNIPHFYFQVFFDKVYGISFKSILEILGNSKNEGNIFFVEADTKNQNKTTTKISIKQGVELAHKVVMPEHKSKMRELARGRLLFHVTFNGGEALLNMDNFKSILGIQ
jgi:type II restriction enzyme